MKLLNFQKEVVKNTLKMFEENDKKNIKIQSPTGSGKTFIIANIIYEISKTLKEEFYNNVTFLFLAPSKGNLAEQNYQKFVDFSSKGNIKNIFFEYIGGSETKDYNLAGINSLEKHNVYFLGWDLLKKGSKILAESEKGNLYEIIENTKISKTKIILIIDEAHREFNLKKMAEVKADFLSLLNPDLIIEMSATLNNSDSQIDIKVPSDEVKKSGLIKQEVRVNYFNFSIEEKDKTRYLIKQALEKRKEIKKSINKIKNSDFFLNPLVLIQIPDKKSFMDSIKKNYLTLVQEILKEFGETENISYAVWLDRKKTHEKSNIKELNSPVNFLIFKQAIATGWDIPRACILVKLRNPKDPSENFEIQTLGRILRNPFLKIFSKNKSLKENDVINLNSAFVFTNDENYEANMEKNSEYKENINSKESFKISKKAKKISLKLNLLEISKDKFQNNFMDFIFSKEQDFLEDLEKRIKNFNDNNSNNLESFTLKAEDILTNSLKKVPNKQKTLLKRNLNESLFFIYLNFLNQIENNYLIKEFVLIFAQKFNTPLKKCYIFFSKYFNQNYEKNMTLKNKLSFLNNKYLKNDLEYSVSDTFELNKDIFYKKSEARFLYIHEKEISNTNSYLMKLLTENTSSIENSLNSFFENFSEIEKKSFHIFRNKSGGNDSFWIEYLTGWDSKIHKFYPDFVLTTKSKIFIIEAKGLGKIDIDKQTDDKFFALSSNIEKIKVKKEVVVVKAGKHENKSNLEFLVFFAPFESKTFQKEEFKKLITKSFN